METKLGKLVNSGVKNLLHIRQNRENYRYKEGLFERTFCLEIVSPCGKALFYMVKLEHVATVLRQVLTELTNLCTTLKMTFKFKN